MPVATVSTEYERKELETVEGGYICIRPLPYGKKLDRREKAMRMSMETEPENRAQRRGKESNTGGDKVDIEMAARSTAQIQFTYCIGEHNLTDTNDRPLDFSNPMTLDVLDPRVGTEIEILLDRMNGDDLDEEDFTNAPLKSSETKEQQSQTELLLDSELDS